MFKNVVRPLKKKPGGSSLKTLINETAAANAKDVSLESIEKPNRKWALTQRGARITTTDRPLFSTSTRFMTIGSCFALEVKNLLRSKNIDVYPKYVDIEFDQVSQRIGKLPDTEDVNHYDTFTISAEFRRAFAGESYQPADFLKHTPRLGALTKLFGGEIWQDPYRRHVFAESLDAITNLSQKLDQCIRNAIVEADVYIITPGVTEAWMHNKNGYFINQAPTDKVSAGSGDFTLVDSTFHQNYSNLRDVCDLITSRYPEKKIILTVSPVPLKRTFSQSDVVIANTRSKSMLRTVASELEREFDNVIYWPSYELTQARDVYQEDGRHINPDTVSYIVERFVDTMFEAPQAT